MMAFFEYGYRGIKSIVSQTMKTVVPLFKIMIPISLGLKLLSYTPFLLWLSYLFKPIMVTMGLPSQTALVWVTTMFTNLYGGLIVLSGLSFPEPLTVAQLSILGSCMLFAHNLPVELKIGKLAGVPMWLTGGFRIGTAFVYAWSCHFIFTLFSLFQTPPQVIKLFEGTPQSVPIWQWGINEIRNYLKIILIIMGLTLMMRLFDVIGLTSLTKKLMRPLLMPLHLKDHCAQLIVIGWLLGLAYGGVLIAEEAKKGLSRFDIYMSMLLLNLSHSFLEDTTLMMVMGGHFLVLFLFRNMVILSGLSVAAFCIKKYKETFFVKRLIDALSVR